MSADRMDYRRIRLAVAAIERGAKALGIRGDEMQRRLEKQGLIRNYLLAGYEPLHTQSFDYVADCTVETLLNWERAQ